MLFDTSRELFNLENIRRNRFVKAADNIARLFSSRLHAQRLQEEIQVERDSARDTQILIGRVLGRRLLEKAQMGEPLDIHNNEGDVLGSSLGIFRSLDPSITYQEMGFTEKEIEILDSKTYFPGIEPENP